MIRANRGQWVITGAMVALVLWCGAAYAADPGNAPVAHWKFDECGGPTAYDSSGSGNNGALQSGDASGSNDTVGEMWTRQGKIGGALECDGLNDHVSVTSVAALKYSGGDMTISVWVNIDSSETTGGRIISKPWNGSGQYNYGITLNSDTTVNFSVYGNVGACSIVTTDTLSKGVWHHIAVSVTGSTKNVKIYFDGKLVKDGTHTITDYAPSSGDTNTPLCISSLYPYGGTWTGNTGFSFCGLIDDMKIYNYARTADQIMVDYNAGSAAHLGAGTDPNEGNPPIGYWPLDENTSTTAYDRSGNGNDGTLTNSPTWATGKYGLALSFNGNNANVSIPNSASLNLTNTGTVEAWVYANPQNYTTFYTILNKGNWGSARNGYRIYHQSNAPETQYKLEISNDTSVQSIPLTITNGMWHHIAMVWNGSQLTGYVDGVQASSANQTLNIVNDTSAFTIGMGNYSLNGKIDDVKIYNYARTSGQIAYDYSRGMPVAHYKFDEGGGAIAHNEYSSADLGSAPVGWWRMDNNWNDVSGNGNNGAASGGATFLTSAKIGPYCGNFNGTDGRAIIPHSSSLNITNAITIEAWIYPKTSRTAEMIYKTLNAYEFFQSGTAVVLRINGPGNSLTSTGTVTLNAWNHIVATYDKTLASNNMKIYINGSQDASAMNYTSDINTNAANLGIGAYLDGSYPFDGYIDDVRIYGYARTPEQIYNDYKTNHGTLVNHAKFADGKVGKALQFDGTDDYVIIEAPDLIFNSSDFSVSLWAKPAVLDSSYDGLITTDVAGDAAWKITRDGGNSYFKARFGTTNAAYPAVNADEWHNYGYVKSGTSLLLYMDGKFVSTNACPATHAVSNTKVVLGSYRLNDALSGSHMYNGLIDDIRIYNYARSQDQVLQDYNAGASARLGAQSIGTSDPWGGAMPIGWWKLDENTGVLAQDASGNENNGTLVNSPTWTQGMNGPALSFNGTNNYVDCGDPTSGILDMGTGAFSVSFWAKPTGTINSGHDTIVGKKSGSWNDAGWMFRTPSSGTLRFHLGNGATYDETSISITNGAWQHVVGIRNGTTIYLYVNGVLKAQKTNAIFSASMDNAVSLKMGWLGGWNYWAGQVDDVKIYNYALTQAQVAWLYNAGAPVAQWKFDEGANAVAYDESDNNNDGGLTNGPTWVTGKFGKCLSFDGTDDYVDCGNSSSLNISTAVTVETWFKANTFANWKSILSKSASYTLNQGYELFLGANNAGARIGNSGYIEPSYPYSLNAGQWYHYVFVWDGSYFDFYLNGVRFSHTANSPVATAAPENLLIGKANSGAGITCFGGLIDDVRIYNYARTQDQILQDYNNGAAARLGD